MGESALVSYGKDTIKACSKTANLRILLLTQLSLTQLFVDHFVTGQMVGFEPSVSDSSAPIHLEPSLKRCQSNKSSFKHCLRNDSQQIVPLKHKNGLNWHLSFEGYPKDFLSVVFLRLRLPLLTCRTPILLSIVSGRVSLKYRHGIPQ
ncbi:hypothetical protein L596_000600 [Steinernema carpocapsae]|uniref:Uncharacterized protein n=1 Tax=Steinernema carpocapsae TaxID=34508 RepID=A0A4U8UJY2_STECR|nr:hypothetical protein L596_000600 [Steinernema carpocapsae]